MKIVFMGLFILFFGMYLIKRCYEVKEIFNPLKSTLKYFIGHPDYKLPAFKRNIKKLIYFIVFK